MTWLLEIKKRLEAATPGPWFNGKGEGGEAGLSRIDNGTSEMFPFYPENHDAEFIANAPRDIAHLLEAIEKKDEALKDFTLGAYSDSDLRSLLQTLRSRAARALAFDPRQKVSEMEKEK